MPTTCECGTLHDAAGPTRCRECETLCCRSCALEVEAETYCRWCAVWAPAA